MKTLSSQLEKSNRPTCAKTAAAIRAIKPPIAAARRLPPLGTTRDAAGALGSGGATAAAPRRSRDLRWDFCRDGFIDDASGGGGVLPATEMRVIRINLAMISKQQKCSLCC